MKGQITLPCTPERKFQLPPMMAAIPDVVDYPDYPVTSVEGYSSDQYSVRVQRLVSYGVVAFDVPAWSITSAVDLPAVPISKTTASDYLRFRALRDNWYTERGVTSSITVMVMCPAYLAIIGMGERAVPLILQQLRQESDDPDHWFIALEAITGVNPVRPEAFGDTVAMAEAWFRWALANDVR
jgi:hypothetical protein